MEHNNPINEINKRADLLGFRVRDLCVEAGVSPSTFYRWQRPEANPGLRNMQAAIDAIDRVLAEREKQIMAQLVERYPEEARRQLGEPS